MLFTTPDFTNHHSDQSSDAIIEWHVPPVVFAMLKNVHLSFDFNKGILERDGDFWYWRLTDYGRDLMRLLVRRAKRGFTYRETFTEPELENIPQLLCLARLNREISVRLNHRETELEWAVFLSKSVYLQDIDVRIEPELFQSDMDYFIERIKRGLYRESGHRLYLPRQSARKD